MIPPTDPAGVWAAVLSAAIFAIALVYLVRSRRGQTDLETSLTSALQGPQFDLDSRLFSTVLIERRPPAFGLLASIGLHVFILQGLPFIPYIFPQKLRFNFRNYNLKIVEFRIPEPLFYTAAERPEAGRPAARARVRQPLSRKVRASISPAIGKTQTIRQAKLLLPWSLEARTKDVVIQPDQPPDIPMVMYQPLPTAFLWAQAPAPLEESRLVGTPKDRKEALSAFSLPYATPTVQKPNRELAIADLQVAEGPILTFRPPQLPVPPANVSPVQMNAPETAQLGELPPTDLPSGNPMNLIALMHTPAPPTFGYLLEAGNRLAESGSGSSGAQGEGKREENPAKTPEPGAAPGDRASTGGEGLAAKGTHADLLSAAPGTSEGAGPGNPERREGAAAPAQAAPTGNMGVIIVQQSSEDSVLEGAEALSGQPIYTVFFDVPGAPRRWVLSYCVPRSASQSMMQSSEGVIRILPRKSVQAPFPLERIPLDVNGFRGLSRRLVLFAMVNERGEIENVRLIRGTGREIDRVAVAALQRWVFRPAQRGETPVAVETLFGIPLE